MQGAPLLNEGAARRAGIRRLDSLDPTVGRKNAQKRIRPISDQDSSADRPSPIAGLPLGQQPQDKSRNDEGRLHGLAALVGQLPLSQQRAIIEGETGMLFGDVNKKRRRRC